jgi:hypothetical protein
MVAQVISGPSAVFVAGNPWHFTMHQGSSIFWRKLDWDKLGTDTLKNTKSENNV